MRLDKNRVIGVGIIVLSFATLLLAFKQTGYASKNFYRNSDAFFIYDVTVYDTFVEIISQPPAATPIVGLNVDPSSLGFGIIPWNGSTSKRIIMLENQKRKNAEVSFSVAGTISPFIKFDENNITLAGGEKKEVGVYLIAQNAIPGNYSGKISVTIKTPKFSFFW